MCWRGRTKHEPLENGSDLVPVHITRAPSLTLGLHVRIARGASRDYRDSTRRIFSTIPVVLLPVIIGSSSTRPPVSCTNFAPGT